ncbi:MAG: DpnD/PcfM family protein [Bacteroidia bacterium]
MKTFKIEIQEFLSNIVEIEAENISDAISKVKELHRNEEIVLDSDDYVTTEIKEYFE